MRFISGLKSLSKKTILLIIIILFVVSWFFFVFGFDVFSNITFSRYFLYFLAILAGFTFMLFIISFFRPLEKMGIVLIVTAAVLTLPIMWVFSLIIGFSIFFSFSILANAIITAFFAFKFCMDTSIKVDDFFYKKESSRIFTRIIEFVTFFLLSLLFTLLLIRFFGFKNISNAFFNLFLIGLILIGIVLIRIIFTKKLAAYITLFNLMTSFYLLYLVIDLLSEFIFFDDSGYDIFAFCIDLALFVYIIGSIYDRVDYIQEKLKIFRVDTIALFVILMKLLVQIMGIFQELYIPYFPLAVLQRIIIEVQILWFFFVIFTLIVGIYTIFKHKEGKSS
ncbi:MAG: hypothetical protein ACFE9X_13555 [Promethearchaeota archaeon]